MPAIHRGGGYYRGGAGAREEGAFKILTITGMGEYLYRSVPARMGNIWFGLRVLWGDWEGGGRRCLWRGWSLSLCANLVTIISMVVGLGDGMRGSPRIGGRFFGS